MNTWAVIPAAGVGRRMGANLPKQYLHLGDRTVIEHALGRVGNHPSVSGVVVAISSGDPYWPNIDLPLRAELLVADGGAERCHSVLNGLNLLESRAGEDDWVLVHDAARPCLTREDLDRLIAELSGDEVGGILATPVRDTMKRADSEGRIARTEERNDLWHALTPQMFRFGVLRRALETALADGFEVTDEASAIEHIGLRPLLVEGRSDNLKVTRPDDLALAEIFLQRQ